MTKIVSVSKYALMNDEKMGVEEGFYQKCADLLGVEHHYRKFPYRKRTRWNNRTAGNGRFPGCGLVRMFGPNAIHVSLYNPPLSGSYGSMDAALAAIRAAMGAGQPSG